MLNSIYTSVVGEKQHEDVRNILNTEHLIASFKQGIKTHNMEVCCRMDTLGEQKCWLFISIDLLCNPISNAIEAYVYFQDVDKDHRSSVAINALFLKDYEMLAQVNIQDGILEYLRERTETGSTDDIWSQQSYESWIAQTVKAQVASSYRQEATLSMSMPNVLKMLQYQDSYACIYPMVSDGIGYPLRKQWRYSFLDDSHKTLLVTRSDVSHLFAAERNPMTGLYNRISFYRKAREILDANTDVAYVIMRLDIDRFKVYNDQHGVRAGDELLAEIGAFLRATRMGDLTVFGHLEGDHFVMLTPKSDRLWETLPHELQTLLQAKDWMNHLQFSIGLYEVTDRALDISLMCDRAYLALSSVKQSFSEKVAWYDDQMRTRILEEQMLISECEQALKDGQFIPYYQPVVSYGEGKIIGAEALVRWNHPVYGMISPGKFISLFERNGFIMRMDLYIWEQACKFMADWTRSHKAPFPVPLSINISRVDIYDEQLCQKIVEIQDRYNLPRSSLKLEITEGVYMENPRQLIDSVQRLREAGFIVAMDDFGAGYSSLNILKDVPVDILKLDMRFLSKGGDDARGGSILSSIIRMARWLDLTIVAEGVETKEQADYLKSLNCRYMQGFFFSRPISGPAFLKMLEQQEVGTLLYQQCDTSDMAIFWDANTQTTMLFNRFMGGAAIVEYHEGEVEITHCNDRFYSEYGISRKSMDSFRDSFSSFFSPGEYHKFTEMLDAAVNSGQERECEVRTCTSLHDGESCWTINRARLLAAAEGTKLLYIATFNTTIRNKLAARLDINKEELSFAIFHLGGMVAQYDIQNHLLSVCEEYGARLGNICEFTDVPNNCSMVTPASQGAFAQMFEQIMDGSPCGNADIEFQLPDGATSRETISYTTIFSSQNKPVQAILSSRDITVIERDAQGHIISEHPLENGRACMVSYDVATDTLHFKSRSEEDGVRSFTIRNWLPKMINSGTVSPQSAEALCMLLETGNESPDSGVLSIDADCWGHGVVPCRLSYCRYRDEAGSIIQIRGNLKESTPSK